MNIVLLGPQGSGKGTQGKRLAKHLDLPHISTGALLRDIAKQDTELAKKVRSIIDAGELVSDELLMQVLDAPLKKAQAEGGFILDGTPRDLWQATLLGKIAPVDLALFINIPEEESIRRISARYHCPKDGKGYNLLYMPPKNDMVCDDCGTRLVQRKDDTPEAIKHRLEIFREQTLPVLRRYSMKGVLVRIDGNKGIEDVWTDVQAAVDAI